MRALLLTTGVLVMAAWSTGADPVQCENSPVTVHTRNAEHADLVCGAVVQAQRLFAQCNVPPLSRSIRIDIVDSLDEGCVAAYHCGENWIEILKPSLMQPVRAPDGAFAFLPIRDYFQSVVIHEMTHAATDGLDCPFKACVVASEYVAYAIQIFSLTPDARTRFVANADLDRRISRDELSPILFYMSPSLFAQKAWTHLSQRDDPCGFIGQILDGSVLLDRERP